MIPRFQPATRRSSLTVLAVAAVLVLSGGPSTATAGWVDAKAAIMGTSVRVRAYHEDDVRARRAADAALEVLRQVNRTMSPYRADSDLSRINDQAADHPVAAAPPVVDVIRRSLDVSRMTHGAFDITFASVGYLYDYRAHKHPDRTTIERKLPAIDYHHVVVDGDAGTVRFTRPGVRIDLGGIAKGYAVEHAVARMRELGIRHGQVTAGGDTRLLGDRRGRPWIIGIQDPRDKKAVVARIPAEDEAVSTSGDYERYFEEDGIRYHHIIDPQSGDSARTVHSVTIIGPNATFTDAFSTSVFVLGVNKGLAFIDDQPDYEAVIVDNHGRMHFSRGLARYRD
ncbi:MAG: FAD:protein FMN transferase [Ectothiorhodospiraceae bacterium]|jgi:thiamine biosynthesis lipoprotein